MKKIGILSWKIGENSFGITLPYLMWLENFGEVKIIDYKEEINPFLDLLVLPGGPDINPEVYGQTPNRVTGRPCIYREYFDKHVLPKYIENNIPIFGICRSLQALNVHFNGTLEQNMYHETSIKSRGEYVHDIFYKKRDNNSIKIFRDSVNSLHHQIIEKIGEGLKPIAKYIPLKGKEMGYEIEAIVHKELPIAAVQYHPEELITDRLSNIIVYELLEGTFNHKNYLEV
jgi:putative glutamine amidotransferase